MSDCYRVPDAVDWVTLDGGVLVMDSTEHLHLLTGTGAEVWSLVACHPDALDLMQVMAGRYPGSARVAGDVGTFLAGLLAKGLLEVVPEGALALFLAPTHLAWTEDADGLVLANLQTGVKRTLSSTASRIWQLLSEGHSPADVALVLSSEFANVPDELADEVGHVVEQLVAEGLLQPVSVRRPT